MNYVNGKPSGDADLGEKRTGIRLVCMGKGIQGRYDN